MIQVCRGSDDHCKAAMGMNDKVEYILASLNCDGGIEIHPDVALFGLTKSVQAAQPQNDYEELLVRLAAHFGATLGRSSAWSGRQGK